MARTFGRLSTFPGHLTLLMHVADICGKNLGTEMKWRYINWK
jgi:hypothetical protein